jgi:hypothetical protein
MPEKNLSEISRSWRELYEKGIAALHKQNYDYALAILNQVLQKEPAFYDCREALRATQFKKAGSGGGFFKKVLGTASLSPLLAKGQIALRSNPLEAIQIAETILIPAAPPPINCSRKRHWPPICPKQLCFRWKSP